MAGKWMDEKHWLVGCTGKEYLEHIGDMNFWGGTYVIDHVRPIASFDVLDEGQALAAFNWRNTQPLTVEENTVKSDRYTHADELIWSQRMRSMGYEGELFLLHKVGSSY